MATDNGINQFVAGIRKYLAEARELTQKLRGWVDTPRGETTSPRATALRLLAARRDELLPILERRARDDALDAGMFDECVPLMKNCVTLLDRAIGACWGRDWVERDPPEPGKARRTRNRSPLPFVFELVESDLRRLESVARSRTRAQRSETTRAVILVDDGHTVKVGRTYHRLTSAQWNFVRQLVEADGMFVIGPPKTRWDRMRARLPADLRKLIEGRAGPDGGYRIRSAPKRAARRRP